MKKTELLTKEDIILINKSVVEHIEETFSPPHNIIPNESELIYLLKIFEVEVAGEPLYPRIYHKAGVYMQILCHMFKTGSRQTAIASALLFLQLNGYNLKREITDKILTNFTVSVNLGEKSLEEVQKWFEKNIEEDRIFFTKIESHK